MNPIKLKLTQTYFLEKIEELMTKEQDRSLITIRRTGALIANLRSIITHRKIINDDFWGYGIERLANGAKVIDQKESSQEGYLITLFTSEDEYLKFHFIRLNYKSGLINQPLSPLSLRKEFIKQASYSVDSLNIYSDQIDEPIKLKIDNSKNAKYFSEVIDGYNKETLEIEEKTGIPIERHTNPEDQPFPDVESAEAPLSDGDPVDSVNDSSLENNFIKKERTPVGEVAPATKPTMQNNTQKINSPKIKSIDKNYKKWLIGTGITLSILLVGLANFLLNIYKYKKDETNKIEETVINTPIDLIPIDTTDTNTNVDTIKMI